MHLFLDSFWRAVLYCLHPRVIVLSFLPLLAVLVLAWVGIYFYLDIATAWVQSWLDSSTWLSSLWGWMKNYGLGAEGTQVHKMLASVIVMTLSVPVLVILALLMVSVILTPGLLSLVAQRRFAHLQQLKGGSFLGSVSHSLWSTLIALLASIASVILYLIPPLAFILPPLIWGWLTYRVMSYDVLAEHASREERKALLQQHRLPLLSIGIVCGYLSTVPGLIWAGSVWMTIAHLIILPISVWIFTLIFAFSALWFIHYGLQALQDMRAQHPGGLVVSASNASPPQTPNLTSLPPPSSSTTRDDHSLH